MMKITIADKSEKVIRTFVVSEEIAKAVDTLLLGIHSPTDLEKFAQETAAKTLREVRQLLRRRSRRICGSHAIIFFIYFRLLLSY